MTGSATGGPTGVRRFVRRYPLVHLGIGLFGNSTFFVGSVLFFWDRTEPIGVWLFVLGSLGMLLGSLGDVLIRYERRHPAGTGPETA